MHAQSIGRALFTGMDTGDVILRPDADHLLTDHDGMTAFMYAAQEHSVAATAMLRQLPCRVDVNDLIVSRHATVQRLCIFFTDPPARYDVVQPFLNFYCFNFVQKYDNRTHQSLKHQVVPYHWTVAYWSLWKCDRWTSKSWSRPLWPSKMIQI